MPTAATAPFYLNPVFLASFGAFAALGLLMLATAYFVMVKMKTNLIPASTESYSESCKLHGVFAVRIEILEGWKKEMRTDLTDIYRRLSDLEKGK